MLEGETGAAVDAGADRNEALSRAAVLEGVLQTITELLERADRDVPRISEGHELMATGLSSLDLAAVIAMLENRWGVDPFLEYVSITEIRTVGELVGAYHACLWNDGVVAGDDDLDAASARAARRTGQRPR